MCQAPLKGLSVGALKRKLAEGFQTRQPDRLFVPPPLGRGLGLPVVLWAAADPHSFRQWDFGVLNSWSTPPLALFLGFGSVALLPVKREVGIHGSYLVDPASSHMLVSKIKPCMSKYKYYTVKLRMAH